MTAPQVPALAEGRFSCPICETRFESVGEKKRHIRENHPKEAR